MGQAIVYDKRLPAPSYPGGAFPCPDTTLKHCKTQEKSLKQMIISLKSMRISIK